MTYEKRCGGAEMEWTFSEKLKRICNVLSVAYIVIGCAFYSWVMDVRDAYPVQGYLVDGVLSSIPYIIAAVVIFIFVFKYCVTNPKVFKVCNIASLFAAASGYIALVVQFVYYLDIIKTYQG
jgi:uncharacterized BrkB/YihY/UPF0761 family membrane protein